MIDNDTKIVSYDEYDRLERKFSHVISKAIIEVRESTVWMSKRKLEEITGKAI